MTLPGGTSASPQDAGGQPAWSRAAIVVAALLCVLEAAKLAAFCVARPAPRVYDPEGYWKLGAQVAAGDVWMTQNAMALRTPGYPWFLGSMQFAFREYGWQAAVIAQYAAVWLTTVLTGWWTWRITGNAWIAVGAIAICVISPARASHASVLLTETLFTLVITVALMHLARADAFRTVRSTVLIAICLCSAVLLRPAAAAIVPAWLVAVTLHCRSMRNSAARVWAGLRVIAVTAGIGIVMLGPWIARNTILFHRPVLTVFLGRELWLSTFGPAVPSAPALPDTADAERLKQLVTANGPFTEWDQNLSVITALTQAGMSEVEADDLMLRVAWQGAIHDPIRATARCVWRAVNLWRAVYSRSMTFYEHVPEAEHAEVGWNHATCQRFRDGWLNRTWESVLLTTELTGLIGLLGIVGLLWSPRHWRTGIVFAAAVAGVTLLTAALEYPGYRYRMIVEPLLIVAGICGGSVLVEIFRRGTRSLWSESSARH